MTSHMTLSVSPIDTKKSLVKFHYFPYLYFVEITPILNNNGKILRCVNNYQHLSPRGVRWSCDLCLCVCVFIFYVYRLALSITKIILVKFFLSKLKHESPRPLLFLKIHWNREKVILLEKEQTQKIIILIKDFRVVLKAYQVDY